jgi:CDP-diacylglycerol--glycerol-3-phosphate 3-phosphatidyltransferase
MVAFVLVLLVQVESSIWMTLPAAIIIGREITISSLRMANMGINAMRDSVSKVGKFKLFILLMECIVYSLC